MTTAPLARPDFSEASANDDEGHTALHIAAAEGNLHACTALLASPDLTEVNAEVSDWSRLGDHLAAVRRAPAPWRDVGGRDSITFH